MCSKRYQAPPFIATRQPQTTRRQDIYACHCCHLTLNHILGLFYSGAQLSALSQFMTVTPHTVLCIYTIQPFVCARLGHLLYMLSMAVYECWIGAVNPTRCLCGGKHNDMARYVHNQTLLCILLEVILSFI